MKVDDATTSFPIANSMSSVPYVEWHCRSCFSFQKGASHPEELVERAQNLGYQGIAITDECSLAGIVRGYRQAKNQSFPLYVGSEFCFGLLTVIVIAPSKKAYHQLSQLISLCRRRSAKGLYEAQLEDLASARDCLLIVTLEPPALDNQTGVYHQELTHLANWFSGNMWLGIRQRVNLIDPLLKVLTERSAQLLHLPLVALGSVDMHLPTRQPLRDVMCAIREHTTVEKLAGQEASNAESHLRSANKLTRLFPPAYLQATLDIAARCSFQLDELRYDYPKDLVPEGSDAQRYLRLQTYAGAEKRYPEGVPEAVHQQIEKELAIIHELNFEHYFLTVWDLVRFARSQGILCQGRGSAANSAVCYCLHITEVNPANAKLLFERFISKERHEPPDIDVDFEHSRREEVIQYIYQRYGRERAGLAATVIRYRAKSAIRDVGKALGFDEHYLSKLIKQLDRRDTSNPWQKQLAQLGGEKLSPRYQMFLRLVDELLGFPRHLSQHVGGFVIAAERVDALVPVENAAMTDRTIIQWDKDDLETLGLLKVDVLALGMLTAIQKALSLLSQRDGRCWRLQDIPREDPATYQMLQQADSIGVFQVESRAQMNMLPRLKPATFYDLVVQVAIVRPGPIQGGMVHPYLQRRAQLALGQNDAITYPSPEVKAVLERTLGVPIFQEQVIKLAMVAAGFSAGEADQLRRAMGAWKKTGQLKPYQDKLKAGMLARGYEKDFADRLCLQIQGFGEYGFPESHAASFAILVYFSAWLKCHEPAIFCCALLNSQPMGFYSPAQLVQDAQRRGVQVLPPCVNQSGGDHLIEEADSQGAIRLGLRLVKGLSENAIQKIENERAQNGDYTNLEQFLTRLPLHQRDKEALAAAGCFKTLSGNRFQTRWGILGHQENTELPLLFDQDTQVNFDHPSEMESVMEDVQTLGLTLERHPLSIIREQGGCYRCTPSHQLLACNHGSLVRVSGLVTGRQRPGTASGATFVTLEDEFGNTNVIVWIASARAQRHALLGARILEVHGILEKEGQVCHVIAGRLIDRTALWQNLLVSSRDFH